MNTQGCRETETLKDAIDECLRNPLDDFTTTSDFDVDSYQIDGASIAMKHIPEQSREILEIFQNRIDFPKPEIFSASKELKRQLSQASDAIDELTKC